VNLDYTCKSCSRNNKVTVVYPSEGSDYPSINSKDENPKAILGLNIHGGGEPVEVDVVNSGPWQASYNLKGKKVTEDITLKIPTSEEQDDEQESYESEDDDYSNRSNKPPNYRWYKEVSNTEYLRVDKITTSIYTDKQIPSEQRPTSSGTGGDDEEEEEKEKKGKGGKGRKK